jgi:hypothetical protein
LSVAKLSGDSRLALIRINSASAQLQEHGREDRARFPSGEWSVTTQ